MIILACAALTLAALLYVFWLTPEPLRVKSASDREREYLQEKREVLYDNLRDLHLEFRMGKLSEPDYQQTKARYQEELALLLHQLETVDAPEKVAAVVPGRCPRCGKDNPADNRFCGACGAELPRVEEAT
ncbi:MAG: zinc ribbon domain-containing protein [Candidatus Acidiferrales bacterium]